MTAPIDLSKHQWRASSLSPTEYKYWLRSVRVAKIRYVRDEKRKMAAALKLVNTYYAGMAKLGLHPLDANEIYRRGQELDRILAEAKAFKESPATRAMFEMHQRSQRG